MVRRCDYTFPDEDWREISAEAKELIKKLLVKDPKSRLSGEQCTKHHWSVNFGTRLVDKPLHEERQSMKAYVGYNLLKKKALHVIAHRLSGDQIQELKNVFSMLDSNKDGTITFTELRRGLERLGHLDDLEDLRSLMENMDVDGNKRIDFSEFIAATMNTKHFYQDDLLWEAFHVFDHDHSGAICKKELAHILEDKDIQGMGSKSSVAAVLEECDRDGNGEIDFHEFLLMMRGSPPVIEEM
jgi:calcium-dependent protein kinase